MSGPVSPTVPGELVRELLASRTMALHELRNRSHVGMDVLREIRDGKRERVPLDVADRIAVALDQPQWLRLVEGEA